MPFQRPLPSFLLCSKIKIISPFLKKMLFPATMETTGDG